MQIFILTITNTLIKLLTVTISTKFNFLALNQKLFISNHKRVIITLFCKRDQKNFIWLSSESKSNWETKLLR